MLDSEIQNVISWLTNGCDPSKAALELAVIASKARAEQARLAEAVRMIEGYKRAGWLTSGAAIEQANDFIARVNRATDSASGVQK